MDILKLQGVSLDTAFYMKGKGIALEAFLGGWGGEQPWESLKNEFSIYQKYKVTFIVSCSSF